MDPPWSVRFEFEERAAREARYRCRGCKEEGQGKWFYLYHFTTCPIPPPADQPEMDLLSRPTLAAWPPLGTSQV